MKPTLWQTKNRGNLSHVFSAMVNLPVYIVENTYLYPT